MYYNNIIGYKKFWYFGTFESVYWAAGFVSNTPLFW